MVWDGQVLEGSLRVVQDLQPFIEALVVLDQDGARVASKYYARSLKEKSAQVVESVYLFVCVEVHCMRVCMQEAFEKSLFSKTRSVLAGSSSSKRGMCGETGMVGGLGLTPWVVHQRPL
jgi:hypothetical protein